MYEFKTRIRYSEVDENNRIRLLSLLNYLQDTSTFHSNDCGMNAEYYMSVHRAWFISYWDIEICSLPHEGENVIMGTSPHSCRGVLAYRNFWLRPDSLETNDYYVKADSVWFLVNTETVTPIRPSKEELSIFGEYKDILGMNLKSRKVLIPDKDCMQEIGSMKVCRDMLDTNHHVNNIRYLDAAYNILLSSGKVKSDFFPSHIRAEYKHAAKYGDTMIFSCSETDNAYLILISSENGDDFCHIEFS